MRNRRVPCAVRLAAFLLVVPTSVHAQTVSGRVLDSLTKRPVQTAVVTLLDSAGTPVDRGDSDTAGFFLLRAPRPGRFQVYADELGYRVFMSDTFSVEEGGHLDLLVRLEPEPVALDEMAVSVRRTEERLRRIGFDRRRRASMGYFVTPEEVERRKPLIASDLLRAAPRVRLSWSQARHAYLVTLRGVSNSLACPMKIVVDGDPVMEGSPLDDIVHARDVLAVEVYANRGGVGAPVQYRGAGAYCGVVLVWTKDE